MCIQTDSEGQFHSVRLPLAATVELWGFLLFNCSVVSDSSDLMDCSLPGSSVHGILQARRLEWVTISLGDLPDPGIKSAAPSLEA